MVTISEALAIALQHHQAGRLQAAEQIYRQVLQVEPRQADAWHLLGVIAGQVGKHDLAVDYIQRAIGLTGSSAPFFISLGNAYLALRKNADATACYRQAVSTAPASADARVSLGNAMREQGNLDEAVACYRRALELAPDHVEAHNNLGNSLLDQGKPAEAIACYRRALELKPDYAEAHNNLGVALMAQDNPEEAAACCRRAVELKPDYVEAHNNLSAALNGLGHPQEAMACCRRALELRPHHAEAHLSLALLSLLMGDFRRGWAEYPWRWKTRHFPPRDFPQPLWDGKPLAGKTILLYAEQGLGDAIQFVRYAPLVKRRGGMVIVECREPLLSLLAACPGIDRVVQRGEPLPPFDVQAPLLSLPGIFQTTLENVPAEVPYLFADPELAGRWQAELGPIAARKIGVFWQGTMKNPARAIPLACFEPLAALPGVRLFSLQIGPGAEQLQELAGRFPLADLGSRLHDFMDTAAVLANLDLLITCDTAVAHLAGALGVAVWVALPLAADWRWLRERNDSPWYPTMRLFRQDRRGDWQGVFRRIETALGDPGLSI
jgi:tetratricopeptide (TPR) repeat protein